VEVNATHAQKSRNELQGENGLAKKSRNRKLGWKRPKPVRKGGGWLLPCHLGGNLAATGATTGRKKGATKLTGQKVVQKGKGLASRHWGALAPEKKDRNVGKANLSVYEDQTLFRASLQRNRGTKRLRRQRERGGSIV